MSTVALQEPGKHFASFSVVQTIGDREREILSLIRRERERRWFGRWPAPEMPWYVGSGGMVAHHACCAEPAEAPDDGVEWIQDETIGGDPDAVTFYIMLQSMSGRCKPDSRKRRAWRHRQINVRGLIVQPYQDSWYCPVVQSISIMQRERAHGE